MESEETETMVSYLLTTGLRVVWIDRAAYRTHADVHQQRASASEPPSLSLW